MFRDKKPKVTTGKPLQSLTEIMSARLILSDAKRTHLIGRIKTLCMQSPEKFSHLSDPLIHEFSEYCQRLPATNNSFYSNIGGMIDYALNRTEAALELMLQFLILDHTPTEEQAIWIYALQSASLLQGIGKLYTEFQISLYDSHGGWLQHWNPVITSMTGHASHYDYQFNLNEAEQFRKKLNLLLAQKIMPTSGFNWLSQNPEVFATWLALLAEDNASAGVLGAILEYADAIAIHRYFDEHFHRISAQRGGRGGRMGTFIDRRNDPQESDEQIGILFIQWLKQALENKSLMLNKAPLLSVPGGLLLCHDIFKLFMKEHPEFKNWQAIQKGFLSLGLHKPLAQGEVNSRFEDTHSKQMHEGIIFSKYALALPKYAAIIARSGQVISLSALEVISQHSSLTTNRKLDSLSQNPLLKLAKDGKWQIGPGHPLQAQPGNAFSG